MKATLSYNLAEEREEFELAQKAVALYGALRDVEQMLRQKWKYEELSEEQAMLVEEFRQKFYEITSGLLE